MQKLTASNTAEYLTAQEVADLLKVSVRTVYRYQKAGLPAVRLPGTQVRYRREDVEQFITDHAA